MANPSTRILQVIAFSCALAQYVPSARAGTESVVYSFGGTAGDGTFPGSPIDVDGVLYGTTYEGGVYGLGAVYALSTAGLESVVHSFRGRGDGERPAAGLTDVEGTLFGTTEYGGSNGCSKEGCGIVYKVHPDGHEKVIYAFLDHPDGALPVTGLIPITTDALYGSTEIGGIPSANYPDGAGTVYKVNQKKGTETPLHSFSGADGSDPSKLLHANGLLYGTTKNGGAYNEGTVFSMTLDGQETVLHSFSRNPSTRSYDGAYPTSGLIYSKGIFYGTTSAGGTSDEGIVFSMTVHGAVTILHSFHPGRDGRSPYAGLIKVANSLYGITRAGGAHFLGTIYVVDARNGREAVLHSFTGKPDGSTPAGSLIYANGVFYGATNDGGAYNGGTVFEYQP